MATEEHPRLLPEYPEMSQNPDAPPKKMIFAAITALDKAAGSNKTSISNYLKSTYGDLLPAEHKDLLTQQLNKLKKCGELVFVKNNYMLPTNPNAPPKRGMGRPPKKKGGPGRPKTEYWF
ncbi:HMG-Y-related protein A-like [Papaver somniferum]|nr:HMG-Y-related protein A-like [Papaver somniferum]